MTILIAIAFSLILFVANSICSRRPSILCANIIVMAISFYVAGAISLTAPHWLVLLIYAAPGIICGLGLFIVWDSRTPIKTPEPG